MLIYHRNASPPTLIFSHLQDRLLFLCPTSTEIEPLLVTQFLHRVADALEEFLGPPLLASKIEASYDVVVQVAGEICDAGIVHNTEPNALREVVEVDDWVGNLLGGIGLPSYAQNRCVIICPNGHYTYECSDLPQRLIEVPLPLYLIPTSPQLPPQQAQLYPGDVRT